jgi:hypothetical protein
MILPLKISFLSFILILLCYSLILSHTREKVKNKNGLSAIRRADATNDAVILEEMFFYCPVCFCVVDLCLGTLGFVDSHREQSHSKPPTSSVGRGFKLTQQKEKTNHKGWFLFLAYNRTSDTMHNF